MSKNKITVLLVEDEQTLAMIIKAIHFRHHHIGYKYIWMKFEEKA